MYSYDRTLYGWAICYPAETGAEGRVAFLWSQGTKGGYGMHACKGSSQCMGWMSSTMCSWQTAARPGLSMSEHV